ncbi:ABC transporter ATP-binding protein [Streptomyces sp. TRM66268-LWL]|uniref:ABC transporter ATP-binding protein n=1 Tax=Streptomyces polyasparticus TaxID=2767826 RepID=A0ABR7SDH0_9ACTN|nr:ABC transporter ATP-binding protein [Streptomyces polyasparticus]
MRAVLALAVVAAPAALAGVLLLAVVEAALPVLAAWLTKTVLDSLSAPVTGTGSVLGPAAALAGIGVAASVLPHGAKLLHAELGRRVGLLAQDRLYAAVNSLTGLGRFEDPAALDRLRLAQQCGQDTPPQIVASAVGLARSTITIAGFAAALVLLNPWLALAVLLSAVPALLTEIRLARARVGTALTVSPLERRESFYAFLLGSVQTAKEIRLFGIGDHLRGTMRRDRKAINATHSRLDRRAALAQTGPAVVAAATGAGGLVWAVDAVARGQLTVGDVALLLSGIAAVQGGLAGIAVMVAVTHQHLLLFGHYLEVTTQPPDLPVREKPLPVEPLTRGLELRDVWFRYSAQHDWVLRGVNLTIPVGGTVALVGDNGAGKSTLVKLLCRFYDPERGSILWDGTDIRELSPQELRSRMSGIFQDFMRYDLSAAENIGLGDVAHLHDTARIRQAAAQAGMDGTLVSLPRGYDTMLSRTFAEEGAGDHDGVELSGGQWQRVGLARGLLRGAADLLILDEPSSGLDPEAEHEIHQLLLAHRAGRTSLLVSHRLNAVRGADLIVVLRGGEIVEQGDHDELMGRQGRYAALFRRQAEGYADAPAVPR